MGHFEHKFVQVYVLNLSDVPTDASVVGTVQ